MTEFLVYDVKAAVLVAVFYLFYRLLLAHETLHRLNRLVLLGTAVVSMVLPLCVITVHHTVVVPTPAEAEVAAAAPVPMAGEVLEPLSRGGDFAYRAFSCAEQALLPDKVPVSGRLVVVEGAYALLPDWGPYCDLALFLQVSQEEQQGRLLLRNGARGMVPFLTRWIPREEAYFAACDVRARCDAVVDGEE